MTDNDYFSINYTFEMDGAQRSVADILGDAIRAHRSGELALAERHYQDILRREPDNADANNLLGVIRHQQGRYADAVVLIEKALQARPHTALFENNLGNAYMGLQQPQSAVECFQRSLQIEVTGETLNNLGLAYSNLGQQERALDMFERALALQPSNAQLHANSAIAWQERGEVRRAIEQLQRAVELEPGYSVAYQMLGKLYCDMGDAGRGRKYYELAQKLAPNRANLAAIFSAMNYDRHCSAAEIRVAAERWAEAVEMVPGALPEKPRAGPVEKSVLNIGYVSPDFRNHAAQYFIEPLLAHHDRTGFRVFCYSNSPVEDAATQRMIGYGHGWRRIHGMDDAGARDLVRQDGIDILVDLAGHTAGNRLELFALRSAPVQLTWFGFPATTGLRAMDYRFTDAVIDPPGSEVNYTEKLFRLAGFYACFAPSGHLPRNSGLPAKQNGFVTFASLSSLIKIDAQMVATWARILAAVPDSRLLLKARYLDSDYVQERFDRIFADAGVAKQRIIYEEPSKVQDFLADTPSRVDIALDSYPYNGAITTFHTLLMGIPVVSLAGDAAPSRVSLSLLTSLGLERFCAPTQEDYVETAVALAGDPLGLERLRSELPVRLSKAAGDCSDFVRQVEEAYRRIWALSAG